MPVAELLALAAPYNPRTITDHDFEALRRSLRFFGAVEPVVANRRTHRLVGGHQRLRAAEAEGWVVMPVHWVDLDEPSEKQLNLSLNRISGDWDEDKLVALLRDLQASGADLDLTGFDEDELAKLLAPEPREGLTEDDDAPDVAPTAVSVLGDVWVLGEHRLVCGDACSDEVLARLMAGYRADLVVTDPPYNVAYEGKTAKRLRIANDQQSEAAFRAFLEAAMRGLYAQAKDGAALYVFHADTEGEAFRAALGAAGWKLSQCCVWAKQTMVMGRQDYHWQHEPVLYGWKPTAAHRWYSDRKQTTLWHFDRPSRSEAHPTMKPVAMLEYLLGNSSRGGDLVLDSFGGSGSTLIACEKLGRAARLVELDPLYCDVIVRRWQDFSGAEARLESGETFAERAALTASPADSGGA